MKKKNKITIFDRIKNKTVELDSKEEWQFYEWVLKAVELGIIISYEYQPASFPLTEKQTYVPLFDNPKNKEKHLFREHVYTADFKITIKKEFGQKLAKAFKIMKECELDSGDFEIYVDTKGDFMIGGTDRAFSINQKLVWEKYKIYINKIVSKLFLQKFGCPEACKYTPKTKKPCAMFFNCAGLEEVLLS